MLHINADRPLMSSRVTAEYSRINWVSMPINGLVAVSCELGGKEADFD